MRLLAISAFVAGLVASPLVIGAEKAAAPEKAPATTTAPTTPPAKGKATRHLTSDQAMNCLKHASTARSGSYITKMEVSVDDGRTICEVHLEDSKGKNSHAHIDVAANKLLRVKD